jgi:RecB family exonuclease
LTQGAAWQDLYKAAMLEKDQSKLHERIEAAHAALRRRIEELKRAGNHDETSAERHAIAEALDSLRMLRKLELRPSPEANRHGDDTPDGGSS